jgi:hypothetical protein
MVRRDANEGDTFRKGFATTALEGGATEGQAFVVGADGEGEFVDAGGGSQTYQSRASYSGDPVTVTTGSSSPTNLTWDSLGQGPALLDLTDPAIPTVVTGGIYSVTAIVICNGFLTAGGAFLVGLHLDGERRRCRLRDERRLR